MDDNLTDEQRADQVRRWIAENGWYLLGGLALGLAALFGWRQWQGYETTRYEEASALYEELLGAIGVDRTVRAEELLEQLARDYGGSPYDDQARLAMAKLKMDRSAPDQAVTYLQQVAEKGGSEELRHVARLRLARVLAFQQKYDEALRWLDPPAGSAFAPGYHEVRGDVYLAMQRPDDARREYEAALAGAVTGTVNGGLLQAKLDGLPVPAASD